MTVRGCSPVRRRSPLPDRDAFETIRFEPDGEVVTIVLDRPQVLNAMSGRLRDELAAALEIIATGPWRSLVLRGDGRAFSSGADLGAYLDEVDVTDPVQSRAYIEAWNDVVLGLRRLPVPSVAAVHGVAYGGGLNLALACDLVIAARSARLCESYVDIAANVDLGGSYVLPRLVGLAQARRLLMLGEVIDAEEALALGLVAQVVDDATLVATAMDVAKRLAAKDPESLRATRQLIDSNLDVDLATALEREAEGIVARVVTPAFQAAVAPYRRAAATKID
jgi:enoyl-CoA hydratase/carnithine racemase